MERVRITVESWFDHGRLEVGGEYDVPRWFANRLYRAGRAEPLPPVVFQSPPEDDEDAAPDADDAEPIDEA